MTDSRKPGLLDVRQIGPNRERDISGVCSTCQTTLLVTLNSPKIPSRDELEAALLDVFSHHVTEFHAEANQQNVENVMRD
ncbi:MAG TPA: hypothetical protein VIW67_17120 [Terriglobales bacterium]|jgi:hypothetical protein